ncbi:MAG: diacylglycerol kinase family lipid kinase [Chloroflexota bacterium]|nr:diacylglycerol kinase family lipid kinase [Chloroflexota bacterium]
MLNARSGTAVQGREVQSLFRDLGVGCQLLPLDDPALDGGDLTAAALDCDVLVAAGGDGTINAVASILVRSGSAAALGILPLGTCNDLARSLGVECDLEMSADVIVRGRNAALDVIGLDGGHICVNQANGGFSGAVADDVEEAKRSLPRPLAYLKASVETLQEKPEYELELAIDGERLITRAINITVANARFSGGGVPTAPDANPSDGLMDVVVLTARSRLGLLTLLPALRAGKHRGEDGVIHRRARQLELRSEPAMPFSVDGEAWDEHPHRFEVEPRRLRVRVPA